MTETFPRALLVGCVLLACLLVPLRLSTATADLPYILDPDEPVLAEPALRMAGGEFCPKRLLTHPASPTVVCLAGAYRCLYEVGVVRNSWTSWSQFNALVYRKPAVLLYVGRLVCGLFGIYTTVALVLLLSYAGLSPAVSLAAGVLHGTSFLYLAYTPHILPDFTQSFLAILCVIWGLKIFKRGHPADYAIAGALIGLAIAAKYTAIVLLFVGVAAHVMAGRMYESTGSAEESRRRRMTALVLAGVGLCFIVQGLTWQHRWLDLPPFDAMPPEWRDGSLFLKKNLMMAGAGLLAVALLASRKTRLDGPLLGLLWDRRPYFALAMAMVAFVAITPDVWVRPAWTVQCLVLAAKSYHPRAAGRPGLDNLMWYLSGPILSDYGIVVLILSIISFLIVILRGPNQNRILVLFPASYLLFMVMGHTRFERYATPLSPWIAAGAVTAVAGLTRRWSRGGILFTVLILLVLVQPALRLARERALYERLDSRIEATQWFMVHGRPGSRILLEERAMMLEPGRFSVTQVLAVGQVPALPFSGKFDYVVTCSGNHGEPQWEPVYAKIQQSFAVLKEFSEDTGQRGPIVTIYQPGLPAR